MTLICAKFDADLINISKVTNRKTKWSRFFGLPGMSIVGVKGTATDRDGWNSVCTTAVASMHTVRRQTKRPKTVIPHRRRTAEHNVIHP